MSPCAIPIVSYDLALIIDSARNCTHGAGYVNCDKPPTFIDKAMRRSASTIISNNLTLVVDSPRASRFSAWEVNVDISTTALAQEAVKSVPVQVIPYNLTLVVNSQWNCGSSGIRVGQKDGSEAREPAPGAGRSEVEPGRKSGTIAGVRSSRPLRRLSDSYRFPGFRPCRGVVSAFVLPVLSEREEQKCPCSLVFQRRRRHPRNQSEPWPPTV